MLNLISEKKEVKKDVKARKESVALVIDDIDKFKSYLDNNKDNLGMFACVIVKKIDSEEGYGLSQRGNLTADLAHGQTFVTLDNIKTKLSAYRGYITIPKD